MLVGVGNLQYVTRIGKIRHGFSISTIFHLAVVILIQGAIKDSEGIKGPYKCYDNILLLYATIGIIRPYSVNVLFRIFSCSNNTSFSEKNTSIQCKN